MVIFVDIHEGKHDMEYLVNMESFICKITNFVLESG